MCLLYPKLNHVLPNDAVWHRHDAVDVRLLHPETAGSWMQGLKQHNRKVCLQLLLCVLVLP